MKLIFKVSMLIVVLLVVESCAKVPITGRRQFNLLPESQLMSMSLTQYGTFLQENEALPESDNRVQMVRSVGNRIAKAVEVYLIENQLDKRIKNFEWEFNVVDQDVINAWCMPGGKVCFYTGILPLTQTETGLAVVMGHEIAHAIARHGNERMSQGMAIQIGGVGLSKAIEEQPDIVQNVFLSSYGLGTQLGSLKYSRKHESESDKMGLIFMALAGYDPSKAVSFWGRMAATGGAQTPEFMSTHPSHETRISDLKTYLPEALSYYKK